MVFVYPVEAFVQSLCRLRDRLSISQVPDLVVDRAIKQNPWFTRYYIQRSLQAIQSWLHEDQLFSYVSGCSKSVSPCLIGIITAGNVPLVGFHDVMTAILCGHVALVRSSHQDLVLMEWVLQQWKTLLPALEQRLLMVDRIDEAGYLLATGSNNTARYLHAQYGQTERLIRHNRYSVAILDGSESDESLQQLSEDIFLYNGLGCRNVSNVLVTPSFDIERWISILEAYPKELLNAHYLEKLTYERARLDLLGHPYTATKHVLIKYSNALDFARMGIIYLIKVSSRSEANRIVKEQRNHIQCVVNEGTEIGKTQVPGLNDFADDINTLTLFASLNKGSEVDRIKND